MKSDNSTMGSAGDHNITDSTGISPCAKITANPVVSCRIEGDAGAVLFNPDTDTTRLINPTGIMIWDFISQPRTIDEIIAYVAESCSNNPDPASVRKDIELFVADLVPDFIMEADGNAGTPAVR